MKKLFIGCAILLLSGCANLFSGPVCRLSEDEYVSKIADAKLVGVIHFADGKANLKESDLKLIREISKQAQADSTAVVVYGHASHRTKSKDPIQRILINLDISNERAINVARALTQSGTAKDKVSAIAMFDSRPVRKEITRADEAANRRAEIYLYWLK